MMIVRPYPLIIHLKCYMNMASITDEIFKKCLLFTATRNIVDKILRKKVHTWYTNKIVRICDFPNFLEHFWTSYKTASITFRILCYTHWLSFVLINFKPN